MPSRVLVVEDDLVILDYCRTVLEAAGIVVDGCSTAAEGRRFFLAERPDLAILDIGLPDGTGIELMQEWHALPGPKVAVIFLTARGDLRTRLDCFQRGAADYVHKPFAPEELLARAQVHLHLRRTQDELVKRNYELELVSRARQDMADMIVHDLKTPLTAIKGTLEVIRARGLITGGQHQNLLDHAGTAADFMLLMLNDLLDVSQASQAGMKAVLSPLETGVIYDKLHALFSERSRKTKVDIAWSVRPGAEQVLGDQRLIYRVLANLIVNAMAVSEAGSFVEVDCALNGTNARFTVSDRGKGVAPQDKKAIFEKYTTTKRGAALDTGSGIGLTFCRVAAEALKGRVWVEDRPGGGSCFHLEFPQSTAVAA
ncbi:MAG: response regulator [Elusimicrobiota bacterium]|nr:response regulator [Elusimicrobiota bacterium]